MLRSVSAQNDPGASHPAHLHTGTCDSAGDVVFPLSNVSSQFLIDGSPFAGAEPVGAASGIPVKISISTVPAALSDIVGGGHTLVVHESDGAIQNYIACGDVGGIMIGTNGLVFALAELNDSDYFGLARLLDNGDGTTLATVYIMHNGQVNDISTGATSPAGDAAAVAIEGFAFNPPTIEIAVSDTVTWTNNDAVQHTVTQDPAGSGFQSGGLPAGAAFEHMFTAAGTYQYFCEFHPMFGTVVVS